MKVGSLVVCVDDRFSADTLKYISRLPVKGKRYVIRRIIPRMHEMDEPLGVALEGIFGQWDFFFNTENQRVFEEWHFKMSRFAEIEDPGSIEELGEEITNYDLGSCLPAGRVTICSQQVETHRTETVRKSKADSSG